MSRLAFAFAVTTALLAPATAQAGTRVPFEQAAFAAAQAANKPILVEVNAWWCPVCASQSRTVEAALAEPLNRDLLVFRINYDKQKPQWRAFGVHMQGTLIAFKGAREAGRLEFVTNKDAIRALIARTAP
jgi:thioredoxin-like negative regulator of GroEL